MIKDTMKIAAKVIGGWLETFLFIFIVLKMTDNIDWSWIIVISPFWIGIIISIIFYTISLVCKR